MLPFFPLSNRQSILHAGSFLLASDNWNQQKFNDTYINYEICSKQKWCFNLPKVFVITQLK